MPHLESYWQKMHVPHVLEACIDGRQWVEARFLYAESGEYGEAIKVMIKHSAVAFNHDQFLKIVKEIRNQEQCVFRARRRVLFCLHGHVLTVPSPSIHPLR